MCLLKKTKSHHFLAKALLAVLLVYGSCANLSTYSSLQAAPIQATASTGTVRIKDSILTITGISKTNYNGKYLIHFTLQNEHALPNELNSVGLTGKIDFDVNGKKYQLIMWGAPNDIEKVSDNTVKGKAYAECSLDGGKHLSDVQLATIKGKNATLTIDQITYMHSTNLYNYDLLGYLKTAPAAKSVAFSESDIEIDYDRIIADAPSAEMKASFKEMKAKELKTRPRNVLPSKGLNLEVLSGSKKLSIDNIGFVDEKLHIRSSFGSMPSELWILNASGFSIEYYSEFLGKKDKCFQYMVYNVKDLEELSKCSIECMDHKTLQVDKQTQSTAWTISVL